MKLAHLAVVLVGLLLIGCGEAQLGETSEDNYKLVMSLNAALGTKSADLLADIEARLKERQQAGSIPHSVAERLHGMISQAKQGQWRPAHLDCLEFMKSQRGNPNFASH